MSTIKGLEPQISEDRPIDRIRRKRLYILVVDDDDRFRASMVFKLEDLYDAVVAEAETGLMALETASEKSALDLIFMDTSMPGMDGIEAWEEIRARGNTVRIVLMSAYYDADKRARAQDLGIQLLNKPVDSDELEMILLECAEGEVYE